MTQRTQEAVDVFLDVLNDGTLAKGDCTACAVGNLAAFGMGLKIVEEEDEYICERLDNIDNSDWSYAFCTDKDRQNINKDKFNLPVFQYFKFTPIELAKIEYAFERNTNIYYYEYSKYSKKEVRADQIKGLEAVIKVMLELDKNVKESCQEVFTKKALALAI